MNPKHSLRARLLLVFTGLIVLGFAALTAFASNQLSANTIADYEKRLMEQAALIARGLHDPVEHTHKGELSQTELEAAVAQYAQQFGIRVTLLDNNGRFWLGAADLDTMASTTAPEIAAALNGQVIHNTRRGAEGQFIVYTAAPVYDDGYIIGAVHLAAPLSEAQALVQQRWSVLVGGVILLAIVAIGVSLWLSASLIRPLTQLRLSALQIAEGNFSQRLPETRQDEIGQLAGAFNHMAAQVDAMLEEQRAFAGNASHELRTPLTAIRLRSEALRDGLVDAETARQYIIEIENNSKPIFLEEPVLPELIIAKDDGVEFVTSPGVTTYTITIENIGEGAALPIAGPEVIDTLPPGMTFGGCVVNPPLKGTCDQSAPGSGIINFELDAQDPALNQDGSDFGPILAYLPGTASGLIPQGTLTVIANIDPGLPGTSTFTNTVTVDWTDLYKNNYKPKEAKDIDKTSSLDLQLSKRHIPIVVEPGGNLTYTITITNVGGAIATGVVITDQIPANTSFVMASDGGTFANGLITWNIPSLNIDETVSRQVVVQLDDPLAPGVDAVTNTACVGDDGASGADRNPQDNCDTVTTPVTNTPQVFLDPIIVKTVDVSDVIPGDMVNYSVTISNPSTNSNISATDVFLIDEMPLEMDLISYSVSANPASLVINSTTVTTDVVSTVGHPSGIAQTIVSTITVELPELGLDQSVTLDIVARANGLAGPPPLDITNVAALECSGCNRKEDRKTVKVRDQGSSPTPTPTRPSGGGNNNDDDDDSGGNTNTSTTTSSSGGGQPSPGVSVPATATPVLPVLLLPETGTRDSQLPGPMALVGLLGAVSLGGLLMWKLLKGNSPE